jgi:carbonic anhydrase
MHFSLKPRSIPGRAIGCVLLSSVALVMSAFASDEHGDAHGHGHDEPKAVPLKSAVRPPEFKLAGKPTEGAARKTERSAGKEADREPSGKGEAGAEFRSASVSMAELRDLIDQKIAEVRTQRQAAPVVRLRPKVKPAPKAPPTQQVALAAPVNDALGALLPIAGEGHDHGPAYGAGDGRVVNPLGKEVHWAYSGDTGPEQWGRLKPEFQQCMLGKRQSPIDIRDGIPVQLDAIQFDYRPSGFRVIDNGHTVQVNVEPGNGITVQGRRYELLQFHFHRPSEERINGKQFELVAHLVHKDMDGKLAVVAVLMDAGKGHPLVQQVWNNLPLEKQVEQAGMTPMDLTLLLPQQRQYYTYMGSLTTPPCTEGVLWMVMKNPATVSREQIGVFSKLYQMNARPIQSMAGRLIKDGQ